MRNRIQHDYSQNDSTNQGGAENSWVRMLCLYCLLVLPMFAVGYRLLKLMDLKDAYAAQYHQEIIDHEIIPARNGRVVAESVVLATDVEQYDVSAHYRWLQHPPNETWLRRKAKNTLPKSERRNEAAVRKAEQQFYHDHESTWLRLSKMIDVPYRNIREDRASIQKTVERIAKSVNDRHSQSSGSLREPTLSNNTKPQSATTTSPAWYKSIRDAVTTQPSRNKGERIIVMEELDYHPVIKDVPLKVAAEIKAHPELYPGFRITVSTQRRYPKSTLAAHTVGSRTLMKPDELKARRDRFPDGDPFLLTEQDRIGRTGVERTYDRRLRGINGLRKIVRDRRGEIVRTEIVREPRSGQDVTLTIDPTLQATAEKLLDEALNAEPGDLPVPTGASVVVLDCHSGAVLAIANAPGYDLNLMIESNDQDWEAILGDPRRPLFGRSLQMALPPGSTFKALTSVALLQSRAIDPDAEFYCQGYLSRPDQHRCFIFRSHGLGHSDIALGRALAQSCNVYFFDASKRMGPGPLVSWAKQFGFGQPTGIDLPFEKSGHLPQPKTNGDSKRKSAWYPGDTMGLAIGQSRLLVTPIQIARMMAAIGNGGYLVTPHIVDDDGPRIVQQTQSTPAPKTSRRKIKGLDEMTIDRVREGLQMVVQHPQGTGYKTVRIPDIKIAGKTGTAEIGGGHPDHAWFAGYAPADQPEVAFVVVLERGGSGSKAAGPIAKQLVQSMLTSGTLQSAPLAATD